MLTQPSNLSAGLAPTAASAASVPDLGPPGTRMQTFETTPCYEAPGTRWKVTMETPRGVITKYVTVPQDHVRGNKIQVQFPVREKHTRRSRRGGAHLNPSVPTDADGQPTDANAAAQDAYWQANFGVDPLPCTTKIDGLHPVVATRVHSTLSALRREAWARAAALD